jgi:hypothetical protein
MSAGPATLKLRTSLNLTYEGAEVQDTYEVFTTDPADGPDVVMGASGLPTFGAASTYDPLSRVSAVRPQRQEDSTVHWLVEVSYSREKGNQEDQQQPPTQRRVMRDADTRMVERALQKDRHGDPILTTAKSPFSPPIVISVPHPIVRFQRWEESFSTALIKAYAGRVNSASFGDYEAGWVMCTRIAGVEQWEQNADGEPTLYWLVTYEFEACYDENDTFDPMKLLNSDFWFIDADGKRKLIYALENGNYTGDAAAAGASLIPSPVPIDEDGAVLQASELPADVHYLNLEVFQQADFNDLNLPVE